ncbi:MAG: ABC transporter permease [Lachnospiraceae bacterium]|nr:ABC transporter permease [Lachnospiraceae bacterium]
MNKKKTALPRFRGADFSYRYFHQCFIIAFTVIAIVIMSIISDSFRTVYNYGNLMCSAYALMMVAFGQFLVILTGGIDISVGMMVSLTNCLSVYIMTAMPTATGAMLAVIITLVAGLLCGMLNGLFVAKFRLPAIIVTIATSTIFKGIALILMPTPGGTVHSAYKSFFNWKLAKAVPMSFFLAVIFIVLLVFLTNKTSFGKSLRAVGGNESAAYGTGVNVPKIKFLAYTLCGFLCAVGGLYLSARTSSGDTSIGNTYTVYSISATVVGGTLMTGAVGEAYGTACGAIIIYLVNSVLNMLNISTYYQYACQGAVLIFALMVGSYETRHRER